MACPSAVFAGASAVFPEHSPAHGNISTLTWQISRAKDGCCAGENNHKSFSHACAAYAYCFFFTVVDSVVVDFSTGASGFAGSAGFTSVLFVVVVDSVVVLGGGVCAGAGVVVAAGGGFC